MEASQHPVTLSEHARRTHSAARATILLGSIAQLAAAAFEATHTSATFGEALWGWAPMVALWLGTLAFTLLPSVARNPHPAMTLLMVPVLIVSAWFVVTRGLELGHVVPLTVMWVGICAVGAGTTTPHWQSALLACSVILLVPNIVLLGSEADYPAVVDVNLIAGPLLVVASVAAVALHRARAAQIRNEKHLAHLAMFDPLTQLANRRVILERADHEVERYRRYGRPVALLIADVDDFKRVNDRFGHDVGDSVLVAVAKTCAAALRASDEFGRVGGEEFLGVLPETDMAGAALIAERLRQAVERVEIVIQGVRVRVTISIGVGGADGDDATASGVLKRADQALLRAKAAGKNRVVVAPPPAPAPGRPAGESAAVLGLVSAG